MVNHPTGSSGGALAHVGATLDLQSQSGRHFQITLTQVVDPAHSTGHTSAKSNKRFVATMFRVTNTSGQALSGDGTFDANLVGSDGQTYLPDHQSLTDCAGETTQYHIAAGKSATSCVPYQVRKSVTIAKVQFFPAAGSAKDYGEWVVP